MSASRRPAGAWGRGRLLLMLGVALLVVVVLVAGVVFAGTYAVTGAPQDGGTGSIPVQSPGGSRPAVAGRDEIAAAPMLQVDRQASLPTTPAAVAGPTMQIPPATGVGPAGVATGFPRTPEGAVGQLAAIGTAVLQGMSIPYTNDVYTDWALPGGVGMEQWPMTGNVQAFLDAARIRSGGRHGGDGDRRTGRRTGQRCRRPGLGGRLRAVRSARHDHRRGPDGIRATANGCSGSNGRWMIAPGASPARAPSTWPGSELSIRAGWRTWVDAAEG